MIKLCLIGDTEQWRVSTTKDDYEHNFVDVHIMASLAELFKEKERSNWLKAWLAIDIAKSGLEHLADNEAQNFHQHIYNQVTSTLTSQWNTCNICNTANLLRNQQCPNNICDKVCQEIINEHRYKKCSWNNTSAQLWQTNYWEIAKCYIQTNGYADKISTQDTDFNGVVSFMLNCTRFDSKFSFPITKGKPTHNTPACLLYKVRTPVPSDRGSVFSTKYFKHKYYRSYTCI
ncbi:hypothetical protein DPMN_158504 [Dreissena polymorpha]|uniref:Uncharacterized protein n=1 Tax=Dreissena polymorpha TaxID=45954 RepID=A0A9D4EJ46_DREPO|nr:hypothetical protein DPMN_158504 [Dreissena polymorpha]